MKQPKNRLHSVLILGATPAGVAAANKLGELGVPITLVDTAADLDRKLGAEAYRLESGVPLNFAHRPGLLRILRNGSIRCAMPATIRSVKHSPQGFRARIDLQPTYVDAQRCTLCGQCAAVCPLCPDNKDHRPIQLNDRMALPGRAVIDKRRMPQCQADCPLGVNVQGYMALAKAGRYQEALDLIRADNVLPAVCGRVCTHPCEKACRRSEKDDPLAIRDIKRFIADRVGSEREPRPKTDGPWRTERIAIVGAGPAGLAAAADLARAGYPVTLYEKEKEAGGLLRYGIGPHRLPRDILEAEVAALKTQEGVEIVYGQAIAIPQGLAKLHETHRAVILATGSWADRRLGVPGETLKGIEGCVSFLTRYYRGEAPAPSGKVAVIGDGNAALDLARVLHRLGAGVTLVSWFAEEEIPADRDEVLAAVAEGIAILDRCQVVGFRGGKGQLQALRLQATRPGQADSKGIRWPEIVPETPIFEKAFDLAFLAIGQSGAYGALSAEEGLKVTAKDLLEADADGRTPLQGIYAAGDAVTGATSVVQAMADGRKTAARVVQDLGGAEALKNLRPARPELRDFDPIPADLPLRPRAMMPELPPEARRGTFAEVSLGFDETQTRNEATRCLQCGICAQCLACVPACADNQAIRHDDQPGTLMENAGVLIIADPDMAPRINGEDVIRAYGPPTAKPDVHAMMLRGFAAAANAMALLRRDGMRLKGHGVAFVPPDPGLSKEIRIGVFACRCNNSFGWTPEMDGFMQGLRSQPDIVHAEVLLSACIAEGIQRMVDSVRDQGLTRLVVASCVCCPLNFVCSACTDQRSRLKRGLFEGTGISRSMVQTCNLHGEVLRLVEKDAETAVSLFNGILMRSIRRARELKTFPAPARSYNFTTAVIGQTEAARSAAFTLAQAGFEVLMFGSVRNPLGEIPSQPGIFALQGSTVEAVSGTLGDFQIHARCGDTLRTFSVGGVVLGDKSRNIAIYRPHEDLPEAKVQSQMQKEGITGIPYMVPCTTSISGFFLADPPGIQISKRTKGEAAAVLAAAAMPRGPRQSRGFSVVVKEALCRGCGRCLSACLYQAISLKKRTDGGITAVVDDVLCKGCGNCISVCPSNAADSPFRDQIYLEETLEELLMPGGRS